MGLRNHGLAQATRALLTQLPHGCGHLGEAGLRLGQWLLQPLKPLSKAKVEVVAQSLPLAACTGLGERDNLCSAHRQSFAIGEGLRFSLF
jgi:hypothetical protein